MSWFSNLFSPGLETATQSTTVPSWMVPYAQSYLQTSQNVANQPYQPYTGQTVAGLNPFQTQAYNAMANRAAQGSPVMDVGSAELQKTLSGGYLNANPHLEGVIDSANRDVMRGFAPVEARSGSFGNSGVQEAMARAMSETAGNLRYQDYGAERGRMMGALGYAPTFANQDYVDADRMAQAGSAFQQQNQAQLSDAYGRFREARDYPQQQLETMGKGLGLNFGSTSTVQTPGTSPMATGVGTAASLYSLANQKSPTVICTELHRQGLMDAETFALDAQFGAHIRATDPAVYAGYLEMAQPVVRLMQRSRTVARLINLLAAPWAREMAHRMGKGRGSLVGKAIMAVGIPACRGKGKTKRKVFV